MTRRGRKTRSTQEGGSAEKGSLSYNEKPRGGTKEELGDGPLSPPHSAIAHSSLNTNTISLLSISIADRFQPLINEKRHSCIDSNFFLPSNTLMRICPWIAISSPLWYPFHRLGLRTNTSSTWKHLVSGNVVLHARFNASYHLLSLCTPFPHHITYLFSRYICRECIHVVRIENRHLQIRCEHYSEVHLSLVELPSVILFLWKTVTF